MSTLQLLRRNHWARCCGCGRLRRVDFPVGKRGEGYRIWIDCPCGSGTAIPCDSPLDRKPNRPGVFKRPKRYGRRDRRIQILLKRGIMLQALVVRFRDGTMQVFRWLKPMEALRKQHYYLNRRDVQSAKMVDDWILDHESAETE